ncbi:hypothetical protein L218DRAFT_989683 [Marasmius fiardii PR-910]|nr:hypothetical protein L218DRAFT_989683 [Marasmius fiardii PR-910]
MSSSLTPELLQGLIESGSTAHYLPGAALTLLIYDHLATLDLEIENVWRNRGHRALYKLSFVLNRYVTEGMVIAAVYITSGSATRLDDYVCRVFVGILTVLVAVVISSSQFFINMRVYRTWETRRAIINGLQGLFVVLISVTIGLSVWVILKLQEAIHFVVPLHTCAFFSKVPSAMCILLGILTSFDFLFILLGVYTALEKPYRTHSEILNSFHADGAKLFLLILALKLVILIISLVGNPSLTYTSICLVFAIKSNLVSRLHLRAEGLRFLKLSPESFVLV